MSIASTIDRAAAGKPTAGSPSGPFAPVLVATDEAPWAEVERARRALADAWQRLRDLNDQREGYRATLRSAGPESDMLLVAAAKVGLEIVDRAIDGQRRTIALRSADAHRAERRHDEAGQSAVAPAGS